MPKTIPKLRAWMQLFKIGPVGEFNSDVKKFYRGNIINVLQGEGWFKFLDTPRTLDEIAINFHYTDLNLLTMILRALVKEKYLEQFKDKKYQANDGIDYSTTVPKPFTEGMVGVQRNFAKALPDRLRGIYHEFSGGFDLYDWDDSLTAGLYSHLRKGAFAFAGVSKRKGSFLDVGCGNGFQTAGIWATYYKNQCFYPGSPMKIVAVDPEKDFIEIARNEFTRWLRKHIEVNPEVLRAAQQYMPEFQIGKAEKIPFDENSFDYVYTSAALHWMNAPLAIKEMVRVAKPGGIIFGSVRLFPHADLFPFFHTQVIKGASGFFYKKDFIKWIKEAGAKKVEFATIVTFFKITK
ncbi:MAG: methyltransferase type 11 [Promethearchaeota archaeon CR_4]|nr:MAG: methyltransferase type 11 [Candidatus Lokiarchaeota archaeon CR_4]